MFSYRHAFHAANHGDVLKHTILIQTINYFKQKDTPFWVLDSHSGTGMYNLTDAWATQSSESNDGFKKILTSQNPPKLIEDYISLVKDFNKNDKNNFYPGSPAIAYKLIRPKDKLFLYELLKAEHTDLYKLFFKQFKADPKQVNIHLQDGFEGVLKMLPPQPRRGLIFIDPPYENKNDYYLVLKYVKAALKKYAQGTYVIWHPLVQRVQVQEMLRSLQKLPVNWLYASLTIKQASNDGRGMHGSGMFIVNPPWTLHSSLKEGLPWLCKKLALDKHANFTLDGFEP